MRYLFFLTRRLAGKHGRHRVQRSFQHLPTPNVHRSWGNMKNLSPQEKEELLHGAWRASEPIQLVADKTNGERDGFPAPFTFSSEEEAQKFLAEEDADDAAELRESTLALAQRFFVELAATANEEVDASQMPPAPQSDEDRRREMRDVQRHFFADFYIEQGVISEAERYSFVDTLLRPSRALFLVNSMLPLVRFILRDQLESHLNAGTIQNTQELAASSSAGIMNDDAAAKVSSPTHTSLVFAATDIDACLYVVPLVPTQSVGAPMYVPYTPATTLVGSPASSSNSVTALLEEKEMERDRMVPLSTTMLETETIVDANMLAATLQDDLPAHEIYGQGSGTEETPEVDALVGASKLVNGVTSYRPPNLSHTYWLQRQVASNSLLNVDLLSHAISLFSVRLAVAAPRDTSVPTESSYAVILYRATTKVVKKSSGLSSASAYHTEIAQYLFRLTQETDPDSEARRRLNNVVLAVEDATYAPSRSFSWKRHRPRGQVAAAAAPILLSDASDVPVADRYPNVVYVAPSKRQQNHHHYCSSSSSSPWPTSKTRGHNRPSLRGRVVVCVPTTSQDGVRPRGWLSSGEMEEENADNYKIHNRQDNDTSGRPGVGATATASTARIFSAAPPNNFVERCQLANANWSRLQQCLYNAIHAVDVGSSGGDTAKYGGWVIYATQSMNVIENEVVVCAVLQQIDAESRQIEASSSVLEEQKEGLSPLHVECVPMSSADMEQCFLGDDTAWESVQRLRQEGRAGLSTWVAIEGGSSAQEVERYPFALRAAVAQASWRTDPMRSGDDGGYFICLRVTTRGGASTAGEHTPLFRSTDNPKPISALCWWTHPQSRITSAVTPAVLRFLETVFPSMPAELNGQKWFPYNCTVIHVGVPVGFFPSQQSGESTSVQMLASKSYLSSATAHAEVLAALKEELPVLQLSPVAFCELLLLKEVSSRRIRTQLYLRGKQLPELQSTNNSRSNRNDGTNEQDVVAHNSLAFLAAVESLIRKKESDCRNPTRETNILSRKRFNLVVEADPASFVPPADQHVTGPFVQALHPAVAAELQIAGVVAKLEYAQRVRKNASGLIAGSNASPANYPLYDFTLRLDVPLDIPERAKHLAAVEEWRVALRDALLYVCRRTGAVKSANPRLWSSVAAHPNENASGAEVQLPGGDEEGVELAEDEYEDAAGDVPRRRQLLDAQIVARSVDLLAREDVSLPHEQSNRTDWLEDTNYLEWRRRQSSK